LGETPRPPNPSGKCTQARPLSYWAPSTTAGLVEPGGNSASSSSHRSLTRCSSVITSVVTQNSLLNLTDRSSVRRHTSATPDAPRADQPSWPDAVSDSGDRRGAGRRGRRGRRADPATGSGRTGVGHEHRGAQRPAGRDRRPFRRGIRDAPDPTRHRSARAPGGVGGRVPPAQRGAGGRRAREHEGRVDEDRPDGELPRRRLAPTGSRRARVAATRRGPDGARAERRGRARRARRRAGARVRAMGERTDRGGFDRAGPPRGDPVGDRSRGEDPVSGSRSGHPFRSGEHRSALPRARDDVPGSGSGSTGGRANASGSPKSSTTRSKHRTNASSPMRSRDTRSSPSRA